MDRAVLLAGLKRSGCRALVIVARSARDPDLAPFVGPVHVHGAFLVAPADGPARLGFLSPMERAEAERTGLELLTPEHLDVARWARDGACAEAVLAGVLRVGLMRCGVGPGRVAIAGHAPAGRVLGACRDLEADGWSFVSGHDLVRRLRKHKTESMIEGIRRAARGAVEAIRAVACQLAAAKVTNGALMQGGRGMTAGDLRASVARTLAVHGLEQPEGNIVAVGRDAAVPHTAGADHVLVRPNRSIVVDLYPKGELFADCTRTFCVGRPSEEMARAHETVRRAIELAWQQLAIGAQGWDVHEDVAGLIAARGYETSVSHPGSVRGYVHGLGHGVGYELHEEPTFGRSAGAGGTLEAGDVLTIEPGLYDEEAGYGVRLEDLVVLGAEGPENLTPLPYDLDPRASVEE